MIRRRAGQAAIKTLIGNHTFPRHRHHRLPQERRIARDDSAHRQSPRTTKLYDRRVEEISLDEVERILL